MWEVEELRRTALSRLYVCPNCDAVLWDRAGDGQFHRYLPDERLIRIFADLDDRYPLGGVRLGHPRTLADIQAQRLLMRRGVPIVVHNDRDEEYARLEWAVDAADNLVPEVWVARPVARDEAPQLRAEGA